MKTILSLILIFLASCSLAQWHWQNPLPQGNHLNDVFFINQNIGWAVGDFGTIIKTTDSGDSWELLESPSACTYQKVEFLSCETGFVIGDNGVIIKTTNGGISWTQLVSNTDQDLSDLHIICPNKIWVCGDCSTILHSSDLGNTWSIQYSGSLTLNSIWFNDVYHGWAVGGTENIFLTYDGGNTWEERTDKD